MITIDLPHLRDGGKWSSEDGLPKRRMQAIMRDLMDAGIEESYIKCMLSDLYWDCYKELHAAGKIK